MIEIENMPHDVHDKIQWLNSQFNLSSIQQLQATGALIHILIKVFDYDIKYQLNNN